MEAIVAFLSLLLVFGMGSAMPRWSCHNVAPPANGRLEVLSSGVLARNTATFRFSCNDGFILRGQCIALCVDGIVIYGKPRCMDIRQCPRVEDPPHGNLRQLTNAEMVRKKDEPDTEKTFAMLIAMTTRAQDLTAVYRRIRLVQMLRLTLETLKGIDGLSKSVLAKPGSVIGRAPMFSLECDPGYVLDAAIFYKFCLEGTLKPMATPKCVEVESSCSRPPSPDNGSVYVYLSSSSNEETTLTAIFSCHRGFRLDQPESKVSTCGPEDVWSTPPPTCTLLCPPASDPPRGRLVRKGDTMRLMCDPGYSLEGPEEIFCHDDATWGLQNSFCVPDGPCRTIDDVQIGSLTMTPIKKSKRNKTLEGCPDYSPCPVPSHPRHGKYTVMGDVEPPLPLSRIRFGCRDGYKLRGTPSVTCGPRGKWTGDFPICKKMPSCLKRRPISNSYTYWANSVPRYEHLSALVCICKSGYTMVGDSISLCVNGRWQGRTPRCLKQAFCPALRAPTDVEMSPTITAPVQESTEVKFACKRGFKLNGPESIQCLSSGSWSSPPPTCEGECEIPKNPLNGNATYPVYFGSYPRTFARFQCNVGFALLGHEFVMCSEGRWPEFPTCQVAATTCPELTAPENGQFFVTRSDEILAAQFSCNTNFVLIGSALITCGKTGLWSDEIPMCREKIPCSDIPEMAHGSHLVTRDTVTELVVTFRCDVGYQLIGQREMRCLETGTWQGDFPQCRRSVPDFGGIDIFEGPIGGRG